MTWLDAYRDDEELARLDFEHAVDTADIGLDPLDEPEPNRPLNVARERLRHLGTGLASCHPARPAA